MRHSPQPQVHASFLLRPDEGMSWYVVKHSVAANAECAFYAALHALHNLGWVHRDISTGNILLFGEQVKLGDLEYAKRITIDEPAHAGIRTVSPHLFFYEAYSTTQLSYLGN